MKKYRIIPDQHGDPCPRCGRSTEVREHTQITDKHLRQPYYYSRWFYCRNPRCRTTMVMRDRYRVFPDEPQPQPVSTTLADVALDRARSGKLPWDD
jgi:hypothetical protein